MVQRNHRIGFVNNMFFVVVEACTNCINTLIMINNLDSTLYIRQIFGIYIVTYEMIKFSIYSFMIDASMFTINMTYLLTENATKTGPSILHSLQPHIKQYEKR